MESQLPATVQHCNYFNSSCNYWYQQCMRTAWPLCTTTTEYKGCCSKKIIPHIKNKNRIFWVLCFENKVEIVNERNRTPPLTFMKLSQNLKISLEEKCRFPDQIYSWSIVTSPSLSQIITIFLWHYNLASKWLFYIMTISKY